MNSRKKTNAKFGLRTLLSFVLIMTLAISLSVFSVTAFAVGPEETVTEPEAGTADSFAASPSENSAEGTEGETAVAGSPSEDNSEEEHKGETAVAGSPSEDNSEEEHKAETAVAGSPSEDNSEKEHKAETAVAAGSASELVPEKELKEETAALALTLEGSAKKAAEGTEPVDASSESDTLEVQMSVDGDIIKAATADLTLPEAVNTRRNVGSASNKGALQTAIDKAVESAQDHVATVKLDAGTVYSDDWALLAGESKGITKFIITTAEGASAPATINCNYVESYDNVITEIINVLFGQNCILIVDDSSELYVGSEDHPFTGSVSVIAGDLEYGSGEAVVYAGNGAEVTAKVNNSGKAEGSTIAVTDKAGDSVVFYGGTTVGASSDKNAAPAVKTEIIVSAKDSITVTDTDADNVDLVLKAPVVSVGEDNNSKINVNSLKVLAASENSEVFDLSDSMGLDGILAKLGVSDLLTISAPVEKAQVDLSGRIKAVQDITVYSFTTQTKFLLDTVVNTALNVKIGSASITVADGSVIEAGRDITLKSTTRSNAGYDEAGMPETGILPLAFNVFIEEASVDLGKNTALTAGNDLTADALSSIKANASCSFKSLFIGVAFNVIINDASVNAEGTSLSANNVNLISAADTVAVADAERSAYSEDNDGLYFATNVVIQSSEAKVGNATGIVAKGDVNISSISNVDATDDAIAAAGSDTSSISAFPFTSALKSIGYDLLDNVSNAVFKNPAIEKKLNSLGDFFTRNKTKVGAAQKFFESSGYTIELDSGAQEKGTVKTSSDGGKISVSIDSKYKVEKVLIRYLPYKAPAEDSPASYKFVAATLNAETGKYEIDMFKHLEDKGETVTLQQFRVYVFYGEMQGEVEMEDMPSDDKEEDDFGLSDLFDTAVESAADDSDADADCAGSILLKYIYKLDGAEETKYGYVVTDAMAASVDANTTSLSVINGVAEGKNVRFNPSPNIINGTTMYKVKSMVASYVDSEGKEKTVTIEKNNAGHYVLAVPTGIKNNSLTITTEWEPGEDAKDTPSTNQITGALGVGVIINHNDAVIDLGSGTITAVGKVNVNADAETNISGKADGTAVTEDSIKKASNAMQAPTGPDLDKKDIEVKEGGTEVGIKLYLYGKSTNEGDISATRSGTVYTFKLSPNADFGYSLPDSITMFIIGEDNREHEIEIEKSEDGTYSVDTKKIDFKTDTVTDTDQEPFAIRSTKFIAIYDAATYKVGTGTITNGKVTVDRASVYGGDTITVKAKADTGYAVGSVVLWYIDKDGIKHTGTFEHMNQFYIYVLPADSELKEWRPVDINDNRMYVQAVFVENTDMQSIVVDSTIEGVTVDKQTASYGEKVTIMPATGRNRILDASKFVVKYTSKEGKEDSVDVNSDLTFTIPVKDVISGSVTFTVKLKEDVENYWKEAKVDLTVDPVENGTVTVVNGKTKTGSGDYFYVNIKGNEGYILKAGTLTAEYVKGDKTVKLSAPVSLGDGLYRFSVSDSVGNESGTVTVKAEFTDEEASSTSTGVAVAVNVGIHRNNSLIKSGTISAGRGIAVSAITNGEAITEALAGYSTAKTGIAGAIAVDVVSLKTNAIIGAGVSLRAGDSTEHELSVNARANVSSFKTDADATNIKSHTLPGAAGTTGVGTGIAVAVNGVDTKASINDGVVYLYSKPVKDTSVSADNTLSSDEVNAKAGANSKKTAVSPVVALNLIGSNAKAYIGRFAENRALAANNVSVNASGNAAHMMTVGSYALGSSAVMAGSFGINIIDDIVKAILNSDIQGTKSDVNVEAQSVSTLTSTVYASAAGAKEGKKSADDSKGSADQKADNIINSGEKLAAKSGMDSASSTADKTTERQQAQTSEGTIAGAAAFILNIQKNSGEARIEDGIALGGGSGSVYGAIGDVRVAAGARTVSDIMADGSATSKNKDGGSAYGIGVAVAINIVTSENKAYIGNGILNASNVSVLASPVVNDQGEELASEFYTSAISGASAGGVGVAGSVALAVLNNTTSASIRKEQNDEYTASSTTVRAYDKRMADTIASASAMSNGKADKNTTKSEQAAGDTDKSVGVGASFAMVYGNNSVTAEFIAPSTADTGAFLCEAVSDHSEESTAVAGTDPYSMLFQPTYFTYKGTSSNIAVDAAVAVNAVESAITARLTASNYTPTIKGVSVRIHASEKGRSKTESSGYAMGTDTAVGGSVAINLNRSSVRASNDCILKVSGDDYTGGDEEDHQRSVEITSTSAVTEENYAFALAAGGDVVRYIEKSKSLLASVGAYNQVLTQYTVEAERLAKLIQGFLDGSYFKELETAFDNAVNSYKERAEQRKAEVAECGHAVTSIDDLESCIANSNNPLAKMIISYIPVADGVMTKGSQALSLSSNLLSLLNIGTPSTEDMDKATDEATEETKTELNSTEASDETRVSNEETQTEVTNNGKVDKKAESMQIAAAVGVSVSRHEIVAENLADIETIGGVEISADNSIDSLAHALGAAASVNGGFGSIAVAIAVKIDKNITKAYSGISATDKDAGKAVNITVGDGRDLIISAVLNENTHDYSKTDIGTDFTSEIGTQAVAGSVSGSAKVAVSGSVAVFVSSSTTIAELADGAIVKAVAPGRAGNVFVTAYETARQTMRTTAISASSANLSLGISAGVLKTSNVTGARVGKNASVKAKNISVDAQRKSVSSDNDSGLDIEASESVPDFGDKDASGEGNADDAAGPTGVDVKGLGVDGSDSIIKIDTSKATDTTSADAQKGTIRVDLDQDSIVELLKDALNMFAGVDYYIAIDAGSVSASSSVSSSAQVGSIAGTVAVVIIDNTVSAIVDESAVLDSSENITVEALSAEQTRLISGAISVNLAKESAVSCGAVIAFLHEKNHIDALVNDAALLTAGNDIFVIGKNTGRSEVYAVTASGARQSAATVAATIEVILSEAVVTVKLGVPDGEDFHSAQAATVVAENSKALRNITVSLAAGDSYGAQVGGAVAVIVEKSSAAVNADGTRLIVTGKLIQYRDSVNEKEPYALDSIVIRADNTHDMFVIVCSASLGRSGTGIAGVVSVILDSSSAIVSALGSVIKSNSDESDFEKAGNVTISALNGSTLLNVNVEAALNASAASTATVGASITVNILKRVVENNLSTYEKQSSIIVNNGDITLTADASDKVVVVAAGANGSASANSVQGSIIVLVERNAASVTAQRINLATSNVGTSISCGVTDIRAKFTGELYGVAGGINFTMGSNAAGATILVCVNSNNTTVDISDSLIQSSAKLDILSSADVKTLLISIGAAFANTQAVEGSVVTVVASDIISIHLGKASFSSNKVTVSALGKSSETLISGAAAASLATSVGPSILVFVKERKVTIDSEPGGSIGGDIGCTVEIKANTDDDIFTLVLAMAASGNNAVSAGICTEIINNEVSCDIDADINAGGDAITVSALSDRYIANYIFGGGIAGNVSVVPVVTVIYLTDKTASVVSGNLKGHIISVTADALFKLKEIAAGCAVSGQLGISGTFAIIVNKGDTRAVFTGSHSGEGNTPELNVLAIDNYSFSSVMANLAGSGSVGVGVTAAVTVIKNNVLASIGGDDDAEVKPSVKADFINVAAKSEREIRNIIGVLSFGGTVGASVNVDVVVAGSKLPQDAYDMMHGTGNGSTFNSANLISGINNGNAYVKNHKYMDGVSLQDDLAGNGVYDSETKGSSVDGSRFIDDLDDDTQDYSGSEDSATEAEELRGENIDIDPSEDESVGENASVGKNIGYKYEDNAVSAAVQAYIKNVIVECLDLSISATDIQKAELDTVTGSGSLGVAAAVGVSVLVLHSNVIAELAKDADVVCRTLDIKAYSGTGDDGKISVTGGVVGAGNIGVAVSVGVVRLDNVIAATLAGNVTAYTGDIGGINRVIQVIAATNYDDVSANSVSIGGGAVAVNASVAIVSLNGTAISTISGNVCSARDLSDNVVAGFYSVNVLTYFNNSITARAAALGAGGIAVAAGVAVASETLTVEAGITKNAKVEVDCLQESLVPSLHVLVCGSYDMDNNKTTQGIAESLAQIAGVEAGGVTVGLGFAIAYNEPTIRSYIAGTVDNTKGKLDVTVGNDIYTKSGTGLFSASLSKASFGANVLLSFNTTDASSTVTGDVKADTLTVMSLLSANAVSDMTTVTAGSELAFGISTALSILKAVNEAVVGKDATIHVKSLNILAGSTAPGEYQNGANFFSDAQLFAGSLLNGISVQLNVAVALNKAVNKATLKTARNVFADAVNVAAYGNPTASAKTKKSSLNSADLGGSAAASSLSFQQVVEIDCAELYGSDGESLATVYAGSYMYPGKVTDVHGEALNERTYQANSSVDIFTIAGLSVNANISYAKNTTLSKVIATFASKIGTVSLNNNGGANARANIALLDVNALGIGANVMLSYVQAQFITELNTMDVKGDVSANTIFTSNAYATVDSVSVSLASLGANVAVAKSTTKGSTLFNGNGGNVEAAKVLVTTSGESTTRAEILKPDGGVKAMTVAANIVESILKAQQTASLTNVNFINTAPKITVTSDLNAKPGSAEQSALAKFEGAPDAEKVNLDAEIVKVYVNVVLAKNYASNFASLSNVTSSSLDKIDSIEITAQNKANATADAGTSKDSDGFEVALVGAGVVVTIAHNSSVNVAKAEKLFADTKKLSVSALGTDESAESFGGTSSNGVVALATIQVNVSDATNNAVNQAIITACGTEKRACVIDDILLIADAENVHATSYIGTAKLTISGINVSVNVVNADNDYSGSAVVENSYLEGTSLDVHSFENRHYFESGKYTTLTSADVGTAGGASKDVNISAVNTSANVACAENDSEVIAKIVGSALTGYAVEVFADGRSDVRSSIRRPISVGLFNVSAIVTKANANGTVLAEFDPANQQSDIASLSVKAYGEATSEAITGAPGFVIEGVDLEANSADARIELAVMSVVSGGKLKVANDAAITSIASAVVNAETETPSFTLAALSININKASATSAINVESNVLPGEYVFGKQLDVVARIAEKDEEKYVLDNQTLYFADPTTTATVSPAMGAKEGARISLIGGSNHSANVVSEHKVTVNIGKDGLGTITAGAAKFHAFGNGVTEAKALDVAESSGLLTAGGLIAQAEEKDVTTVNIAAASITSDGTVDVSARNGFADVTTIGETPGGLSLVNVCDSRSEASIRDEAVIRIGGKVVSLSDITLDAYNKARASSSLSGNAAQTSAIQLKSASVSVVENLITEILFGDGSLVQAKGSVKIDTNSYGSGSSAVDQTSGAVGIDCSKLYGDITLNAENDVELGKKASVTSDNGDISVNMTNGGFLSALSDYDSEFDIIGINKTVSDVRYTAANNMTMSEGSSLRAGGNVVLNQDNSDITASSSAHTNEHGLLADLESTGKNTITSNNTLTFADIGAEKAISISQYGGTSDLTAAGMYSLIELAAKGDATGINIVNINNTLAALSGGDLQAADIRIVQGADRLGMDAFAQPNSTTVVDVGCDGTAKNTITVTNVLKGGSGEIGAGANRSFVSDIAGASGGSIECEMKKEEHSLIDFSSTTEKNTLHVDSQIGKNYSGFVFSQNEFPRDRILCDGKSDGGADVRYTNNPVTAPGGQQNNPERSSSSWIVTMFHNQVREFIHSGGNFGLYDMKISLDNKGFLVMENFDLFAANLEEMDLAWLYEFLTADNVRFMANFDFTDGMDIYTSPVELVNGSYIAKDVEITENEIRYTVEYKGEDHVFEIVFNKANGDISAFCIHDGVEVPLSILVIEIDGVRNVVLFHEEMHTSEALIFIPTIVNGDQADIKVKVKKSFSDDLLS